MPFTPLGDGYASPQLCREGLSQRLAGVAVDGLEDALRHHGKPEIFNSDQDSQFSRAAFTGVLKREGVTIRREGWGLAFDKLFVERLWCSVKHEDVSLKGDASMGERMVGLADYLPFTNGERPHPLLGQQTPDSGHRSAIGGAVSEVERTA